jgi:hypothetical protein
MNKPVFVKKFRMECTFTASVKSDDLNYLINLEMPTKDADIKVKEETIRFVRAHIKGENLELAKISTPVIK